MTARFRKYIGWPFLPCGQDKNGIDCLSLYRLVAKREFNLDTPDYHSEYGQSLHEGEFDYKHDLPRFAHSNLGKWLKVDTPIISDAILLRIYGHPLHVGMVVSNRKEMLHIERGCDSVIERYDNMLWRDRIVGFYRWAA